jgi:tartrate dehydrogenase/decarboxylase/D-malate dehydrogenase
MTVFRVAVIGGDGIGPEVTDQAVRAADAALRKYGGAVEWNPLPWSSAFYQQHGFVVPPDGWDLLRRHDAILFGAIGSPAVPDHIPVHQLLLPMRRRFDQYVNYRPAYLFEGVQSPLCQWAADASGAPVGRPRAPGSIDLVVYRENTEGEYAPVGGRVHQGGPAEVAVQSAVFTRRGCERIIRAAFEGARRRRNKVTSVTKSNALVHGMGLWDEAFAAVRQDYPDVEAHSLLVDAAAMDFVRRPEAFDVVVASNLFGDILTDLAAIVTGSVGLAASGNINPERAYPSFFEPIHGSAPDIAGQGIANPMAAVLSAGMLLRHLGLAEAGAALDRAVAEVLRQRKVRTPDLGGTARTADVGAAVAAAV